MLSAIYAQVWRQNSDPRGWDIAEEVLPLLQARHDDVAVEFQKLVSEWKADRSATSFASALAMHPAYQRIIGMGKRALPYILAELEREPDHWFWALRAISGQDPVPSQSRGKIREMITAWLNWGRQNGYVR